MKYNLKKEHFQVSVFMLALALRIIQLAGGKITADSKPGAGTTFTVYLTIGKQLK